MVMALSLGNWLQRATDWVGQGSPLSEGLLDEYRYLYILGGCALLLVVVRLADPRFLRHLASAAWSLRSMLGLLQEGLLGLQIPLLLLDLVFLVTFSMLAQLLFFSGQPEILWMIFLAIATGFGVKLILVLFFGWVFFGRAETAVHLLSFVVLTRWLGILLVPVLLVVIYQNVMSAPALLYYILTGIGILYTFWLLRLFVRLESYSLSRGLYVFLYLCTLELVPVLLFYKAFLS